MGLGTQNDCQQILILTLDFNSIEKVYLYLIGVIEDTPGNDVEYLQYVCSDEHV